MPATNAQVQQYVNDRVRPWSESLRAAYLQAKDHKAAIDDVYANVADAASTWADGHTGNPPHLLTKADVLAWNAFVTGFIAFVEGDANYSKALQACVRTVSG